MNSLQQDGKRLLSSDKKTTKQSNSLDPVAHQWCPTLLDPFCDNRVGQKETKNEHGSGMQFCDWPKQNRSSGQYV